MEVGPLAEKSEVGRLSVAGLACAPFAILFSFWIPTLALLFAAVTLVTGALDLRGSTGPRRRVALLTGGLGLPRSRSWWSWWWWRAALPPER